MENRNTENKNNRKIAVWDNSKDEYLCREVLLLEPYLHKSRTQARGNAWKAIAAQISSPPLNFKVDARAVRERFAGLLERFKSRNKEELAASGVAPEPSQLNMALEDIVQQIEEAEHAYESKESESNNDKQKEIEVAKDMRQLACETFGETSKRRSEESGESSNKRRRSDGSDTLFYLREKAEREQEFKRTDIDLRKQELELRKLEIESQREQNQQIMAQMMLQNQQMFALLQKNNNGH